jgi:hypothetical protein
MSVSTLEGKWSFGPQTAKNAAATTFYEMRTIAVRGGPVDVTEPMPPELGGVPIADGAHKLGSYYAATVDMIPRLEEDIGWLLFAACGNVSTVTDSPEAGLQTHYFRMNTSDYMDLKWLTLRREIPSEEGAANSGLQGLDCKIANLMLNLAGASRLTARFGLYGRVPSFSDNVSGWTENAAEGATSIALSSSSGSWFKIPDFQAGSLPFTQARITLNNTVSRPQQEFIIGSYHPDDVTGLYRTLTVEGVYKWEDEDLWLQLAANGGTGASIAWTSDIFTGSISVKAVSPSNVSGLSNPYSLTLTAPNVYFATTAPPEAAGVNIVQLPITGFVARPTSGDAFLFALVNEVASYTWPS